MSQVAMMDNQDLFKTTKSLKKKQKILKEKKNREILSL